MYKPIRKADLIIGGTAVKQGEIFTLGFQLFDANGLVIVPSVGQTISVKIANKTGVVFETTAVVVSDHIEFTVAENIGAGKMRVELTVADGVNVLQKYPANGYIELYITASLDDIGTGTIYTVTAAEMFTRIEGSEEASASAVQTAGEAVVIAESAVETADAVRADFDLVVAEAGSSNPEVVLARGEFVTLEGRLDDANQQLADTSELIGESVEKFPIVIPEADDTGRIQRAINSISAKGGGILNFYFKNYTTGMLTMKSNVWLSSFGATLTHKSGLTGYFLNFQDAENVRVTGFILDGLNRTAFTTASVQGTRTGMYFNNNRRIVIEKTLVIGFDKDGAYLTQLGAKTDSFNSKAVKFHEVDFELNYRGLNFDTRAEYCQVNNVSAYSNFIGARVASGNIHFVGSFFNRNIDGIHVVAGQNDSHGSFTGCASNHNVRYALMVDGITVGETFNGCHFYYGDILLKDSLGVQIIGGHLAVANIFLEGGGWNAINDNFLQVSPTITRGYNGKPDKTEIKNNRRADGTSLFKEDTATVYMNLKSVADSAVPFTAKKILKFSQGTGGFRYTLGQIDTTLYDSVTGRGLVPYRRNYAIQYTFKLTNLDAVNDQRVLIGIQVYQADGVTAQTLMSYQYVTIPKGATNHVISDSWNELMEAGYQYEMFVIPANATSGVQITANTEVRFNLMSLD